MYKVLQILKWYLDPFNKFKHVFFTLEYRKKIKIPNKNLFISWWFNEKPKVNVSKYPYCYSELKVIKIHSITLNGILNSKCASKSWVN